MLHTPVCDQLGITYPIILGGMGSATSVPLVTAVSQAGGLRTLGATGQSASQISERIAEIRAATDKPFGVNYLLFRIEKERFAAALAVRLPVLPVHEVIEQMVAQASEMISSRLPRFVTCYAITLFVERPGAEPFDMPAVEPFDMK